MISQSLTSTRVTYTVEGWAESYRGYWVLNLIASYQFPLSLGKNRGFPMLLKAIKYDSNCKLLGFDGLENNWEFSRELQIWKLRYFSKSGYAVVTCYGTEQDTGEHFEAFQHTIPKCYLDNQDFSLKFWVACSQGQSLIMFRS